MVRNSAKWVLVGLVGTGALLSPSPVASQPAPSGERASDARCMGSKATIVADDDGGFLIGTDGNDTIVGSSKRDVVLAGAGSDRVCTRRGNDVVRSDGPGTQTNTGRGDDKAHPGCNFGRVSTGPGDDTLHPVPDSFTADGGGGEDRAQVGSCWGRGLTIRLDSAGDAYLLDPFTDRDAGLDNFERLAATPWPDLISGSKGADILAGRQGNDRLRGYRGDDRLLGGAGRDRLIGGLGSDRVNGGTGRFDAPDSCSGEVVIGCEILI